MNDPQWVIKYAENLKTRRDVRKLIKMVDSLAPGVAKALIHERDAYSITPFDIII